MLIGDREARQLANGQRLIVEASVPGGRTVTSDPIFVGDGNQGLQLVATASSDTFGRLIEEDDGYCLARHSVFGPADGELTEFLQRGLRKPEDVAARGGEESDTNDQPDG